VEIAVRGKNLRVTEALERRVEDKLKRLERFTRDAGPVHVLLVVEREEHEVEVTMPLRGGRVMRAKAAAADIYTALDRVQDKLAQGLTRRHDRRLTRRHGQADRDTASSPPTRDGIPS
jgi:putative sigma-54 modulation protein